MTAQKLRKAVRLAGLENIKISQNYHYSSGFATGKNGQIWYFNTGDDRHSFTGLLVRTAESYRDFTGGINKFADITEKYPTAAQVAAGINKIIKN